MHDVQDGLRPDELRERRDQNRVPELLADPCALFEHLLVLVRHLHVGQLHREVGQHPAGKLMLVMKGVEILDLAERLALLLRDPPEMFADLRDQIVVEIHAITERAQVCGDALRGRLRSAVGQRRDRGVDAIGAGLDAFQIDQRCDAGHAVTVQLDRNGADRIAECGDQGPDAVDGQQTTRVLDPDRIHLAALDQIGDRPDVDLVGVDRREAVRDGADRAHPELAGGIDGDQHVVHVVQTVERRDFAAAVRNQAFDPKLDDVVRNEVEAHDALRARERAHRRLLQLLPHEAQALPWVFLEEAHADVELDRAGDIESLEADVVHLVGDGQHVRRRHAGRPQTLMRVA